MVQLTDDAATMIVDLVHAQALPPGAGLRIAQREDHPALAMSLAAAADPGDVVVVAAQARVFLAPVAQQRLAHAVLDARRGGNGTAFFLQP